MQLACRTPSSPAASEQPGCYGSRRKKKRKKRFFYLHFRAAHVPINPQRTSSEPEPPTAMPVKTSAEDHPRGKSDVVGSKQKAEGSPIGADGVVLAPTPPTPGSTERHDIGGTLIQ